ncbi:hypothetical protein HXX76_012345 [Chlamydomonas incerta]|uniref:Uncharacterized protein n=1 Tax=Chlamydomonas incerta TaxID=51695 RepID=A0A835VVV4_CHLIN|nr:hypothetical protein HXX76_012345 [Chlamydomonas incerta]|eukprot:KAG2427409.1 hypothetical protein HXX76_012345 [Chlamydomonas incerta]
MQSRQRRMRRHMSPQRLSGTCVPGPKNNLACFVTGGRAEVRRHGQWKGAQQDACSGDISRQSQAISQSL